MITQCVIFLVSWRVNTLHTLSPTVPLCSLYKPCVTPADHSLSTMKMGNWQHCVVTYSTVNGWACFINCFLVMRVTHEKKLIHVISSPLEPKLFALSRKYNMKWRWKLKLCSSTFYSVCNMGCVYYTMDISPCYSYFIQNLNMRGTYFHSILYTLHTTDGYIITL